MERSCGNSVSDGPVDGALKDIALVVVHTKHKAPIDHDAEAVKSGRYCRVIPPEVLPFAAAPEVGGSQRLESDKQAAKSGVGRALDQVPTKYGVDRRGSLKKTIHSSHSSK